MHLRDFIFQGIVTVFRLNYFQVLVTILVLLYKNKKWVTKWNNEQKLANGWQLKNRFTQVKGKGKR